MGNTRGRQRMPSHHGCTKTHVPEWNGSHCVLQLHSWDALVHTHDLGMGDDDVTRHDEISCDASCDLLVSTSQYRFAALPEPTGPEQSKEHFIDKRKWLLNCLNMWLVSIVRSSFHFSNYVLIVRATANNLFMILFHAKLAVSSTLTLKATLFCSI